MSEGMILCVKPETDDIKLLYTDHDTYNSGDAGIDLFFPEDINLPPKQMTLIDLQIRCEGLIEEETVNPESEKLYYNTSYYLYPRSSISKTPLRMANSVGIIDSGYRGTLKVAVDNISDKGYTVSKGQRLFQICAPDLGGISLEVVNEISITSRGTRGFGSTGGTGVTGET